MKWNWVKKFSSPFERSHLYHERGVLLFSWVTSGVNIHILGCSTHCEQHSNHRWLPQDTVIRADLFLEFWLNGSEKVLLQVHKSLAICSILPMEADSTHLLDHLRELALSVCIFPLVILPQTLMWWTGNNCCFIGFCGTFQVLSGPSGELAGPPRGAITILPWTKKSWRVFHIFHPSAGVRDKQCPQLECRLCTRITSIS